MRYLQVPVAGGEVQINVRTRTVDLILAVEDGSRTVRMTLYGTNADYLVRKIAGELPAMQQNVLEQFTRWIED